MPDVLVFTLAAPMASFGTVAGNERRTTDSRPGHSLVAGLLGAALGLKREDERLIALSEAIRVAVDMAPTGRHLRDFHTIQSVKARKGRAHATRRQALAEGEAYTTISLRDYVTDLLALVAVTVERGPFTLYELAGALQRPRFLLYAGRKSCPLALPPSPLVIPAKSIEAAFIDYRERILLPASAGSTVERMLLGLLPPARSTVSSDSRLGLPAIAVRERRRTRPLDRGVWTFGLLEEHVLRPGGGDQ